PEVHGVGGDELTGLHLREHFELQSRMDVAEQHEARLAERGWNSRREMGEDVELRVQRLSTGEVRGVTSRPLEGLAFCHFHARRVHAALLEALEHRWWKILADHTHDASGREQAG